jgi:sarcosine oxidase, subunit gamma
VTATERLSAKLPLGAAGGPLAACSSERFACREDPFRVLTELRCAGGAVDEAVEVAGLPLPGPARSHATGSRLAVSLGPNWWLLDSPAGSAPVAGTAGVSAVDVSASRVVLRLSGPAAVDVLAHGCSLDLHPTVFAVGATASTLLAKAPVVLARPFDDEYRCWVRSSYARYLSAWLIDAATEYR